MADGLDDNPSNGGTTMPTERTSCSVASSRRRQRCRYSPTRQFAELRGRKATGRPVAEAGYSADFNLSDETARERAARAMLCRQLEQSWAAKTLDGLRVGLKASYRTFVKRNRETLDAKYGTCGRVLEVFLFACNRGELGTLLRKYRAAGLKISERYASNHGDTSRRDRPRRGSGQSVGRGHSLRAVVQCGAGKYGSVHARKRRN